MKTIAKHMNTKDAVELRNLVMTTGGGDLKYLKQTANTKTRTSSQTSLTMLDGFDDALLINQSTRILFGAKTATKCKIIAAKVMTLNIIHM